jgi:hypothetical protein
MWVYALGLVATNAAIVLLWRWRRATIGQQLALLLIGLLGVALYVVAALT